MTKYQFRMIEACLCLLLTFPVTGNAQDMLINTSLPQVIPASPEAAAIAKYLNYPVDYSSGLVKIEIPLYTLQVGDLTLPISLSYHASGLKVNENSGWVGSGWTLNAEPSLSRSVKGLPDERYYLKERPSYLYHNDYLDALSKGEADEEPDEFYYKLLDKSGSFYFRKGSGTSYGIVTYPYEPINISHRLSEPGVFTIKDDHGIHYHFGSNSMEYIERTINEQNQQYNTQYKISRIASSKTGEEINFNYYPSNEQQYPFVSDFVKVEDAISYLENPSLFLGCNWPVPFVTTNDKEYYIDDSGQPREGIYCNGTSPNSNISAYTIHEKKLESIIFTNGEIWFDGSKRLKQIKVTNDMGRTIRTIRFFQSEYLPGGTDKWKLDSIQIVDGGNVAIERYNFSYYNGNMPSKTSRAIDHWGYYNGRTENDQTTAIPVQRIEGRKHVGSTDDRIIYFNIGGADREPDEDSMKTGILTSITYPSRGKTYFEYEANKYLDNGALKTAGGLRIGKIITDDPVSGQNITRTFVYGRDWKEAGNVKYKVKPEDYMYQYRREINSASSRVRIFGSNAIPDLFFSAGSPVFYDKVTEYVNGEYATVYEYNWQPEPFPERSIMQPFWFNIRDICFHRNLISKVEYHHSRRKIRSTTYAYHLFVDPDANHIQSKRVYQPVFPSPQSELFDDYETVGGMIRSGCLRLKTETVATFDQAGENPVIETKSYTDYNKHKYPQKIETQTSNGGKITEYFYYTNEMGTSDLRDRLISDGRLNALSSHDRIQNGKRMLSRYDYALFENKVQIAAVVTNTGENQAEEVRVRYHRYDKRGNPVSVSYEGGVEIVYLWGYNYQYPIAVVENATYETVIAALGIAGGYDALASGLSPDMDKVNGLRSRLRNAMVTTYVYRPLIGLISEKDPSGREIKYSYDNFHRLSEIKNENDEVLKQYRYRYAR